MRSPYKFYLTGEFVGTFLNDLSSLTEITLTANDKEEIKSRYLYGNQAPRD